VKRGLDTHVTVAALLRTPAVASVLLCCAAGAPADSRGGHAASGWLPCRARAVNAADSAGASPDMVCSCPEARRGGTSTTASLQLIVTVILLIFSVSSCSRCVILAVTRAESSLSQHHSPALGCQFGSSARLLVHRSSLRTRQCSATMFLQGCSRSGST
jgi:hypothetical protein